MIRVSNLSFSYKNKEILENVSFEVKEGEFILIAGDNGSGKTTLLKCLNGLIPHYTKGHITGSVFIDDIDIHKTPIWKISQKVGTLLQDFQHQIFSNIVKDELMLMAENLDIMISEEKISDIANILRISDILNQKTSELSNGQMQKVALGSILTVSPDILLLDEPTSSIDKESTLHLLEFLSHLKNEGKTIFLIDHNYKQFLSLADKIFFIKDGAVDILSQNYENVLKDDIYTSLDAYNPTDQENILECKNLSYSYKDRIILKDVNFTLKKSECIGIIGDNGSGKTTLGKIMSGILPMQEGIIQSKAKKILMVLPNPSIQLFFDSVQREISFNALSKDLALDILQELGFMAFKDKHPHTLSYGQKQLLTIGSSLAKQPDILILDEPTSALSTIKKEHLAHLLRKYQKNGLSLIILSHDIYFLKAICNKIMRLEGGILYEY